MRKWIAAYGFSAEILSVLKCSCVTFTTSGDGCRQTCGAQRLLSTHTGFLVLDTPNAAETYPQGTSPAAAPYLVQCMPHACVRAAQNGRSWSVKRCLSQAERIHAAELGSTHNGGRLCGQRCQASWGTLHPHALQTRAATRSPRSGNLQQRPLSRPDCIGLDGCTESPEVTPSLLRLVSCC